MNRTHLAIAFAAISSFSLGLSPLSLFSLSLFPQSLFPQGAAAQGTVDADANVGIGVNGQADSSEPLFTGQSTTQTRAEASAIGSTATDSTATGSEPIITPVSQTPAAPPPPAVANEGSGSTDHEQVVGHLGVGFFGNSNVAIVPGEAEEPLSAPSVGVRYWLSDALGLEGAFGMGLRTGSNEDAVDPPSRFALNFHFGVPLALAYSSHYAFLVIPEADIAFGSGTDAEAGPGGEDLDYSTFTLEAGARAGAEVQFGFINIPQLSLQATVGAHLGYQRFGASSGDTDTSVKQFTLGTSRQAEPWSIFIGNVAAIYYF